MAHSEFHGRQFLVLGAAVGLSTGMTATMFYSLGAFVPSLQAEFGWDRGSISLAVTIMTIGLFLSGPLVGRLCDRYGAALLGAGSLLAYAAAVVLLALLVQRIEWFWAGYFFIAVLGAGSTPIALVRPVTAGFERRRGLALGIVLTGAGIAGFWVPNLVAEVSERAGWRIAYLALASTAVLAAPLVWFGFRRGSVLRPTMTPPANATAGLSMGEALRTRSFWLLMLMALTMALGIAGLIVHLVPLFRDLGAPALNAAHTASVVGASSVFGRIAVGLMLDRFAASRVSMLILFLATLGILLLWLAGLRYAVAAVILLGLAAGAEIDLLAYLTARHFGQRAYGAIYGWQYSVFALGYGLSPFLVGLMRDVRGDYHWALLGSAATMAVAALAALSLGASRQRLTAAPAC